MTNAPTEHEHRRLLANVAWLLVDRGARLGIAFATGIWVARQLGPERYGLLSYSQATVGVLAFLSLAAIEAIVVRMLVDEPDRQEEILGSALLLRLGGGLVTVLASLLAAWALGADRQVALITPLLAGATVFQAFDVVDYWFRRRLLSHYGVVGRLLALCAGAVLRAFAAIAPHPLETMALAILAEAMLVALALSLAIGRTELAVRYWRPARARAHAILRQAAPMLLSAAAVAVYVRFGFLVLGKFGGNAQVGQLGVASTMAETLHALPVAVAASYGPVLLRTRVADPGQFQARFLRLLRLFALASLAISLLVSLASPRLMPFAFGESYRPSGDILAVLVWSIVFVYLSVASELWFVGNHLQRYLLPKTLASAVLFVLLTLWLVPRHGAIGAAVATVLTYSFSAYWSNLFFRRTRPLFYWQTRALLLLPMPAAVADQGKP